MTLPPSGEPGPAVNWRRLVIVLAVLALTVWLAYAANLPGMNAVWARQILHAIF